MVFNPNGTEKVPTLYETFREREKHIPEIGKQLQETKSVEVDIAGDKFSVDCRVLSIKEKEDKEKEPIVLLQGFGSGWEGAAELGFSLACEGRKVVLLSLPGYGNSEDPPREYYEDEGGFNNESESVRQVLEHIQEEGGLDAKKVHLIGHSMGAIVATAFAEKNSDMTSSVTLLNPAAVKEKENPILLGAKFSFSGAMPKLEKMARLAFSGEREYFDKLQKYVPKVERGNFFGLRAKQRLSEIQRISSAQIPQLLQRVQCPVVYMPGEFDFVYPAGKESGQMQTIQERANNLFAIRMLQGMHHNTTTFANEVTANNIDAYLIEIEEKKNV